MKQSKQDDERYTVQWVPVLLVEQAAEERGYKQDTGYSFWDFVEPEEFMQSKSFKTQTEAFRAAKSRVRIDVCGEVRICREVYDANLDYWEERSVFHVYRDTKNMKEAA